MTHAENNEKHRLAREAILRDFRAVFTSDAGQRVLDHLRAITGADAPSFVPPRPGAAIDPLAGAIRDGRRQIWLEIRALLDVPEDETPAQPKAIT